MTGLTLAEHPPARRPAATPGRGGGCRPPSDCGCHQPAGRHRASGPGFAADFSATPVQGPAPAAVAQAKPVHGGPADDYEREADQLAGAMLDGPATVPVRRLAGHRPPLGDALGARIGELPGTAHPLPTAVRAWFEPRLGTGLGDVRVHTGSRAAHLARSVGAVAFTRGRDIAFADGRYAPGTRQGRWLLGHELVHVVQQRDSWPADTSQPSRVVQPALSPELGQIEDLLSYSIIDWAITDEDAVQALDLLKQLPSFQQAAFFGHPTLVERLRDNLPAARVEELNALQLSLLGITPTADLEELSDKLSYGLFDWAVTDEEAVEVLEALQRLSAVQRAVALSTLDYRRLLENLPESRRQELADLYAQALGPGGARETLERTPQTINSLTFTSDHGVMRAKTTDWGAGGELYGEPEWRAPDGRIESHPVSQTRDSSVEVELNLDVLPAAASPAPLEIDGSGGAGFLDFSWSGATQGGPGQVIAMSSAGKLPNEITASFGNLITWTMRWQGAEQSLGITGGHTLFVTMDTPRMPDQVTYRRMEKAVELCGAILTLDPHGLVAGLMRRWTNYDLDRQFSDNPWRIADDIEAGAQCIDLVRFVMGLLETVGCPGLAEARLIWARATSPDHAEETPWGGESLFHHPPHPLHPTWRARLLDADKRPNNFEAALKFTHGGETRYYPGGVDAIMHSADEVLRVFNCFVWYDAPSGRCRVQEILASYQGEPCEVGEGECSFGP